MNRRLFTFRIETPSYPKYLHQQEGKIWKLLYIRTPEPGISSLIFELLEDNPAQESQPATVEVAKEEKAMKLSVIDANPAEKPIVTAQPPFEVVEYQDEADLGPAQPKTVQ